MKQYKDYQSQVKDVDEKGRVLVAANAIGNIDADKDISESGSFDKTLQENFSRLKWFLNHDKNLLLGVPLEGKQNGKYLEMLGQLNMKKQLSQDVYTDYKLFAEHNRTLEHSIGVEALKSDDKSSDVRRVFEWKLWEYSTLYSWGANADTPMLAIKSAKSMEDALEFLNIMLRKGDYTDKRFLEIEQTITKLKTLASNEPLEGTQGSEPSSVVVRDWSSLTTFINN